MSLQTLLKALNKLESLPTLPTVILELQRLVYEETGSAKKVEIVLSKDPALTTRILRVVNSAYYGLSHKVSDVTMAAVILGSKKIADLALTSTVLTQLEGRLLKNFDYVAFWEHSLTAACCAEAASEVVLQYQDEAFIAGLLHDIGKLFLALHCPEEYEETLELTQQDKIYLFEAEQRVLGMDHAEVGFHLLRKWQIPDRIAYAVKHHHVIGRQALYPELAAIVYLANVVAKSLPIGFSGCSYVAPLDPFVPTAFGLTEERFKKIVKKSLDKIHRANAFFELIHQSADLFKDQRDSKNERGGGGAKKFLQPLEAQTSFPPLSKRIANIA